MKSLEPVNNLWQTHEEMATLTKVNTKYFSIST